MGAVACYSLCYINCYVLSISSYRIVGINNNCLVIRCSIYNAGHRASVRIEFEAVRNTVFNYSVLSFFGDISQNKGFALRKCDCKFTACRYFNISCRIGGFKATRYRIVGLVFEGYLCGEFYIILNINNISTIINYSLCDNKVAFAHCSIYKVYFVYEICRNST